jgi:hypothetical protein
MNEQSTTKLIFWDVQHGSAAYIRTPKKNIVVDLGSGSYGTQKAEFSPLLHLKYKWNVDRRWKCIEVDNVIQMVPMRMCYDYSIDLWPDCFRVMVKFFMANLGVDDLQNMFALDGICIYHIL